MLSHVVNSQSGANNYEMHVDSLFRITFIPPSIVTNSPLLTEQVKKCTGWKIPGPENVSQSFMQAKRNYASTEVDNTQELEMEFELNLNNELQNFVYNSILAWKKLIFNPLTGERGLKKDYIGQVVIESFAANGEIYWTRTLHNAWPKGDIDTIGQNDYSLSEPTTLTVNFVADYYTEQKY